MGQLGVRAVLCLLALAGAAAVETGRWRYGSISWKRKEPGTSSRKVIFTVETAWRYSHGSMVKFGTDQKAKVGDMIKILASDGQDPLFAFGDGNVTARFDVRVVKVDAIQDLLMGESTFEWDFWARGPWTASLTLCCRVAENQNGMRSIMLESTVDLTSIDVHGSPQVRVIPRLALQAIGVSDIQQFEVPAVAAEGYDARAGITWQDAPQSYWDNLRSYPANSTMYLGVNQTTGMASVNVKCYRGQHCVQDIHLVIVVSRAGATGMVDFIVRVQKNVPPDTVPEIMMKTQYFDAGALEAGRFPPTSSMESGELRGLPTVEAFADFAFVLTFLAKDALQQEVYFEYNMLPVGALIGTKSLDNPLDQVYAQEIRWTPNATQVGEHYFCGVAFDRDPTDECTPCTPDYANDETSCVPFCPVHLRSKPLCFNVQVFANTAPIFSAPLPADRSRTIDMNEPVEIRVEAGDANWMDPVMLAVEGVHPEGSYITKLNSECGHYLSIWRLCAAAFLFKWTPSRKFGGWSQDVCFRAVDQGAVPTKMCIRISVNSCRWQASVGQSLDSIATLFGSNYVQMWALNSDRNSPDLPLKPGDKLSIGHKYQLRATDNFRYLSVQFATTRATIEMLNYDLLAANSVIEEDTGSKLADKAPLAHWAGNEICILPHSCVDHATVVAT